MLTRRDNGSIIQTVFEKGDGSYAQLPHQQHDDGYDVHVPHVHDDVRAKT